MSRVPFGFKKAEDSHGFLLWQTTTLWQRKIKRALEDYDITHPQFVILATLLWFQSHGIETTQIQIAIWTKLDKMTVSNALRGLAGKGLVHRNEHEKDTRAKTVRLTKEGEKLAHQLVPVVERVDEIFFGKLSNAQKSQLLEFMRKLTGGDIFLDFK